MTAMDVRQPSLDGTAAELALEALLVASPGPVSMEELSRRVPAAELEPALGRLADFWVGRGMTVRLKDGAASMVPSPACVRILAEAEGKKSRSLSAAAVETLSYVALNQPVSLADVERGRGVKLFKGVMDSLLDAGFVRASLRRTDSGRAVAYVTTDAFLEHFGLTALADLPTPEELPELVDPPSDRSQTEKDVPQPQDDAAFGLET